MHTRFINAEPDADDRLARWTILATIFGFWLFYAILISLRAYLVDFPAQDEMALRRIIVTIAGMVITIGVWLLLRPFDHKPLQQRILLATLICIPAALGIALINYYMFYMMEVDLLTDLKEVVMIEGGKVTIIKHKEGEFWIEVLEAAMSRYFFLIAWCSLYIALGYAQDVRRAERYAAQYARAAQVAELRALRYQVNPHFLFNALNSLSALVMAGRKEKAETFIMSLASFYRTSLAGDVTQDVPLSEELAVQRLYLDIEGTRFSDRLKTEFDIPESLTARLVPGMILQPLVENAIKHGVSRTAQTVTIRISAQVDAARLKLTVCDDAPHAAEARGGSGIGLSNVRDRLMARYGDDARIEAAPLPGKGYCVTLFLPEDGGDDEQR